MIMFVPSWWLTVWWQFCSCRHVFIFRFILFIDGVDGRSLPVLSHTISSFLYTWLLLVCFFLFLSRWYWSFLPSLMVGFMTRPCSFLRRQAIPDNHSLRKFGVNVLYPWIKICQFQCFVDLAVASASQL